MFVTGASGYSFSNPITLDALNASGKAGWYGWPKNAEYEALRQKWAEAAALDERKAIAKQMQKVAWDFVPMIMLGQALAPAAFRANVHGFIGVPEIIPFWNVEKT